MTDKERRASKYLPFDSLKGLQNEISKKNKKVFKKELPVLSEEQKIEMDITLFDCYSQNKVVSISYYDNGNISVYSGVISKIDVINKQLILIPKKRFKLDRIIGVFSEE